MVQEFYVNLKQHATPAAKEDLVNKGYVDDLISGKIKEPVRVLLGTNFEGTYEPTDMTLTQDTASVLSIDGITVELNDRVLLVGQTDATQNGIYTVTTLGTDTVQAVLTRSQDFNTSSQIKSNVRVPVSQGVSNGDTSWVLTTDGTITLDTTSLNFVKFSATDGVKTAVGTFTGDGVSTEFTITHGLNTLKPACVTVYREDGTSVGFGYKSTTNNTLNILSDVILESTDGEFTVVVTA